MFRLWPPDEPVSVRCADLVLREWRDDAEAMVVLFETEEMDRRTPLTSPFTLGIARRYVENAHRSRRERGALQLVITDDRDLALGEVLAFPTEYDNDIELAYAVGAEHQGRGLARRALTAVLGLADAAGISRAVLRIAPDNEPSQGVARACGFTLTDEPLVERRRKEQVLHFATWVRRHPSAAGQQLRDSSP